MHLPCKYGDLKDELICDRLVVGLNRDNVRKALLRESNLTLEKALHLCQVHEFADHDSKAMSNQPNNTEVHTVGAQKKPKQPNKRRNGFLGGNSTKPR